MFKVLGSRRSTSSKYSLCLSRTSSRFQSAYRLSLRPHRRSHFPQTASFSDISDTTPTRGTPTRGHPPLTTKMPAPLNALASPHFPVKSTQKPKPKQFQTQRHQPQARQVKLSNIIQNLVQNSRKANPKQRALVYFLGLVDQFFQFPNNTPIARTDPFDTRRPVIFTQAQLGQRFRVARLNSTALARVQLTAGKINGSM